MSWGDLIQAAFGEPRGDEPASLRRDIADELADHLACAEREELRKTDDEEEAKANALERFGDPKKVARELWWLSMKETVMKDRVLIAVSLVAVALCVIVSALSIRAYQRSEEVNDALLARLQVLEQRPSDWTTLTVRLKALLDKEPAAGWTVELRGEPFHQKDPTHRGTTGADGSVRIGFVKPGKYQVWVKEPGDPPIVTIQECVLHPVPEAEQEIIVGRRATVVPRLDLPPDLKSPELVIGVGVKRSDGRTQHFAFRNGALSDCVEVRRLDDDRNSPLRYRWKEQPHKLCQAGEYVLESIVVMRLESDPASPWVLNQYALLPKRTRDQFTGTPRAASFVALPAQESAWRFSLTDDLIEEIREALRSAAK
jgi:hypothetical protein